MKTDLPFKHENQKTFFNNIHPLTRFFLPFILIIPTLFQNNVYLILTILILVVVLSLVLRLQLLEVLSRIKVILGFLILVLIFVPFYVGETIMFSINIGLQVSLYKEGFSLMVLIFLRVFTAALTFLVFFTSLTYSEFIEALITIRLIPSMLIGSIIIMLHYIPILSSSNKKILEAQELRGKNISKYSSRLKTHAFIMGKNIVNNMERSERIYESLKMRGFTGKITFIPTKFRIIDYLIIITTVGFMIILTYLIDLELISREVIFLFSL